MQKISKTTAFALTLACAACFSAPASAGTAEEIAAINEQVILLQARLKKLQVEDEIAKQNASIAEAEKAANTARGTDKKEGPPPPVVRSIEGYGGKLTAQVAYTGGETAIATPSGALPGGWSVVHIKENEVALRRDGKVTILKFGYAPAGETNNQPPRM